MLFRNPLKHLLREAVKPVGGGAASSEGSGWEGRWWQFLRLPPPRSLVPFQHLTASLLFRHNGHGADHTPDSAGQGSRTGRAKKFSFACRCLLLLVCFVEARRAFVSLPSFAEERPRDLETRLRRVLACSCRPAVFFTKVTKP